ncbi:GAF domain-containing protein [Desulfosporosinus orientis DSM 765]|uniref:GAF domain-containing protein n=1 Tax=Desulfosporosinus orientis (strain ATCC 19365 / DSM 765 / NCIMB 8382 / VKM B-1628 / Singapore I) TaxID=768706 RepID=G7W9N2_DESOD|nr:GAF domain-containing protein [Desulfosporosinus orientis]AET69949.1 GAF domain-containing protein [Desulfosporosinus orientis DSM 765]
MSKGLLKKLVSKKGFKSLIADIEKIMQSPFCIKDEKGKVLIGNDPGNKSMHPVNFNSEIVGWVCGDEQLSGLANLLSFWMSLESEKTSLGKELLDRYREITFYFNITEQLAGNHGPKEAAKLLIAEAKRIIKAEDISILLIDKDDAELLATSTSESFSGEIFQACQVIVHNVLKNAKPEVINQLSGDHRCVQESMPVEALMCAPLTINNKILGVIMVSNDTGNGYTAGDLKMLMTVAYQAAAAIENAKLVAALKETIIDLQTKKEELTEAIKVRMEFSHLFISVVLMFSLYTFLLAIMDKIQVNEQSLYVTSRFLEISFVFANVWLVFRSGLPLNSFGITLLNTKKAIWESLLISAVLMSGLVIFKWYLLKKMPAFQGASIFTWNYVGWDYVTYIVVAPLQEFLTRGVLQGSIQRFLMGRFNWLWATILTSTLFGVFHVHESLMLGIAAIAGGMVWGSMYARHKNLIGVSLCHFLIGNWLGILGLWNMMIG